MRVGIVCPYTWDVPGGVQAHVRDLAETLIERKELHGDEISGLLERQKLEPPEVDLTEEDTWPKL